MQGPLFVRLLTDAERWALEAGLRSPMVLTLRRCQVLLTSARGEPDLRIARVFGCSEQTVRNATHAFEREGVAALTPGSSRPHSVHAAFDAAAAERLTALLPVWDNASWHISRAVRGWLAAHNRTVKAAEGYGS